MTVFEWTGVLSIFDLKSTDRYILKDDKWTVTFDPLTGRLTATGQGTTVEGSILRSAPDPSKSPIFLSCDLDDGTPTLWRLYGATQSEGEAIDRAYGEWLVS